MKELKFKTSKGEFMLIDGHVAKGGIKHEDKIYYYFCDAKKITEYEASEIVEFEDGDRMDYGFAENKLHSLLKSKGINLFENPLNTGTSINYYDLYREAVQKTFYNPYIFKL